MLDELRMKMLECLLVLQVLPEEADLNFADLAGELQAAHRGTQEAYQAASLIHQRASLDGRWSENLSRPKAIFARHNAAVRRGAVKVTPAPAICDRLERRLYHVPSSDRLRGSSVQRPRCAGVVRATGQDCSNPAVYLGSGTFGAHCYVHATPTERDKYRAHHEALDAHHASSGEDLYQLRCSVGQKIAAHWISTRERRIQWVDSIAPPGGPLDTRPT
ncbi:hypothetical protein [Mycobacteroides abscessus]|uniref:hypothetical protein n=1 Tax=Mycobacteroides abscessus TaxID=36809 RepID=UPI001F449FC2|nr:hypothetical protein [Mycobacteroides abscessus]